MCGIDKNQTVQKFYSSILVYIGTTRFSPAEWVIIQKFCDQTVWDNQNFIKVGGQMKP